MKSLFILCCFGWLCVTNVISSSKIAPDTHYSHQSSKIHMPHVIDPMSHYYINNRDCESYDYGTDVCSNFNHLWDCPETPIAHRNTIGRAVFQTPELVVKASQYLIKKGIIYNIHHDYSNDMPFFGSRTYSTAPHCFEYDSVTGYCDTWVNTSSIGNVGTQFDGFLHFFFRTQGDTSLKSGIWFNNFRYDDLFLNNSNSNAQYIGINNLPQFFTRCILVDIASYLSKNTQINNVANGYVVTKTDFINTLKSQNLFLGRNFQFERGDVVLFRLGYAKYYYSENNGFYGNNKTPGISFDIISEYLWDSGVMIVGSDNFGVDPWITNGTVLPEIEIHRYWIVCGGGFIHEALYLDEWANDAKKGFVPYIGVYSFGALPVVGAAGGAGKPVILL